MEELVYFLLAAALASFITVGIYHLSGGGHDDAYREGYNCASTFHAAPTKADTLQAIIDGCTLLEASER